MEQENLLCLQVFQSVPTFLVTVPGILAGLAETLASAVTAASLVELEMIIIGYSETVKEYLGGATDPAFISLLEALRTKLSQMLAPASHTDATVHGSDRHTGCDAEVRLPSAPNHSTCLAKHDGNLEMLAHTVAVSAVQRDPGCQVVDCVSVLQVEGFGESCAGDVMGQGTHGPTHTGPVSHPLDPSADRKSPQANGSADFYGGALDGPAGSQGMESRSRRGLLERQPVRAIKGLMHVLRLRLLGVMALCALVFFFG